MEAQDQSWRAPNKAAYLSRDTIAALASATGGAVAIVRISGPDSFMIAGKICRDDAIEAREPRKFWRSQLFDPTGAPLDDALLVRFVSPESFTGENVVELHIHGGSFGCSRVMESLISNGARQALPGEFSFRAVRNGKMSLSQAEAVADLIQASNDGASQLALEKLSGSQNRLLDQLARDLRKMAMLGEVGIDFADQDIEEVSLPSLKRNLVPICDVLNRFKDSYDRGIRMQDGLGVALIGLPNAGKSSFFNSLLGEDRSIVSADAGTTRDLIRERITLRGERTTLTLRLEDTAGLRHSDNSIEVQGIERSKKAARHADLVLLIVDPLHSLDEITRQWAALKEIPGLAQKTLGILTKSDLYSNDILAERLNQLGSIGARNWVVVSALTRHGISDAIREVTSICEKWIHRQSGEVLLTRLDHFQATSASLEHLSRAQAAAEIDLFAADVRQALHALGPLIGETLPDDILGQIFSEFCIGK